MKKIVKIISIMLVLIFAMACLASCAKTLSGEYKLDAAFASKVYKFSGSKVAITYEIAGFEKTIEGKYEIGENDKGESIITFTFDDNQEDAEDYKGEYSFSEGEEDGVKYIKIGGAKYIKQ